MQADVDWPNWIKTAMSDRVVLASAGDRILAEHE